jgi:hypothetical protein
VIDVKRIDTTNFEVTVKFGDSETTHMVVAEPAYVEKLTGNATEAPELIEKSFEFLLAREPNTSILRSFDLPTISRYFPEYEQTMTDAFRK